MQTLAQSGFLKALGWSLINSLWQMSVLWLVYFLTTFNSKKFSATVRHSIAALLLSAGVGWFIFTFIYYCANNEKGNVFSFFIAGEPNAAVSFFNGLINTVNVLLPYAACLYLLVLSFQFVKYSKYFFHSQKLVNEGLHRMNPQLRMFADEIAHRLGIHKKVQVFLSDIADSPMTIGFLKYIILIPLATINNLTTQQVEAILLHELAHIKRNDYLLNLMITVVEMLFFFNPFCRLFINVIKRERENSCDDLVMQFQYDPHIYVSALLSLEKSRHDYHPMAIAATGKNNKLLLQRVKRITGQSVPQPRIKPKLVLLFLFFVLAGCIMQLQFKILPKAFQAVVSKTADKEKLNTVETKDVLFTSAPFIREDKSKKSSAIHKQKARGAQIEEDGNNSGDGDLVEVSSDQQERDQANDNVVSANQTEVLDFSMVTPKVAETPEQNGDDSYYPYVPRASYKYEVIADTSSPQEVILTPEEVDANSTMEKSLKALELVDWKKIGNELKTRKDVSVNIKNLKLQLRKSLATVDWKKINKDVEASTTAVADPMRITGDIQMQLEALRNLKTKNELQAEILEEQIKQNQIKLRQATLQKQREQRDALRKTNTAKRKTTVVYI